MKEEIISEKEQLIEWLIPNVKKDHNKIEEKRGKRLTKSEYEELLHNLNTSWERAIRQYDDLCKSKEADRQIMEQVKELEEKTKELQQGLRAQIRQPEGNLNLPQYIIPTFYGDYEKWPEFLDGFTMLIHDEPRLSKLEKMKHLKTHVKGEAGRVIQNMNITEKNYDQAWDMLKGRYQNTRLIVKKLIDKLLDAPDMQYESAVRMKNLLNLVQECTKSMDNIGVDTSSWGPIINVIVQRKWDQESRKLYEQNRVNSHEIEDLAETLNFMTTRYESLELCNPRRVVKEHLISKDDNTTRISQLCIICNLPHQTGKCKKLIAMTKQERWKIIKERKGCVVCLKNHAGPCGSLQKCKICNKNHHSLLHQGEKGNYYSRTTISNYIRSEKQSVLATALIKVSNNYGAQEILRALIDPGSQTSLITERAAQILSLPREKINQEIVGLGEDNPKIARWRITADMVPRFPSNFNIKTSFIVLDRLTQAIPQKAFKVDEGEWNNKLLADPTFNNPGPIDVLLGVDVYPKIITEGIQRTTDGLLGQNTELGWVWSGDIVSTNGCTKQIVSALVNTDEADISKFWELEEINPGEEMIDQQDYCEQLYQETTTRRPDGKYVVKIPFKEENPELGPAEMSKAKAISRLYQVEKRFQKQPKLKEEYTHFMKEYRQLGHMEKVSAEEKEKGKYYIPHQAVLREDSTTTKLRVVFDASSTTGNGLSLNQAMYAGPILQADIAEILLRWRSHQVAFVADIEKMYRQIYIAEEDKPYHRIMWRDSTQEKMKEYQMTTLTYGTAAAPYLAIRTLRKLADDEQKNYPRASEIAKRDYYVDDLLSGGESTEEAIQLQEEMIEMMKAGGFNLRKWYSNDNRLLMRLPEELREETLEISEEQTKKTLGIHWAPKSDRLTFQVQTSAQQQCSKRSILSEVAKIFDPLGILAPVIITAKLLIQELWLQKISWAQQLPAELQKQWTDFRTQLPAVQEVSIPRWTNQLKRSKIQLHGFCDASEKAYGACIYTRITEGATEDISVRLLIAKSKVAPIKTKVTLPRLELCAATLLARLMEKVTTCLQISKTEVYAWSDSMITIAWIQGDSSRWKKFVENRVIEIKTIIPGKNWHYVNTKENPADIISRGIKPSKLKEHTLWLEGPCWLKNRREWPEENTVLQTEEEMKRSVHVVQMRGDRENTMIERFSSYMKLIRVTAYCRRFMRRCLEKSTDTAWLTVKELQEAKRCVIKIVQEVNFSDEIKTLKNKHIIKNNSKISNLAPFLDENELLRVGGRLKNAVLSKDEKHSIIIPQKSFLDQLIIRRAHEMTMHGGTGATHAYVRKHFWIPNAKKMIASYIHKCTTCIRYRAKRMDQMMGDLPASRVRPAQPFDNTGIDYAGPVTIRAARGRGQRAYKGYIAVFVCLATKAIHLEVVGDMTTTTFLAALSRFTARRGNCSNIYSDNGTTFVGAYQILQAELQKILRSADVQDGVTSKGLQWHFIPPSSPHFGGLWEAGVKSMKYHMKRIMGEAKLTFEELTTLMCQIEACLNSRPLITVPGIDQEVETLTPGHFLIGKPLLGPPSNDPGELKSNLTIRWKLITQMKKDFWKVWKSEYLSKLQQRNKWKQGKENISVGEIVLIKEESHPGRWPLAKVIGTNEGKDGKVRVVTVQKEEGKPLKRAITNLVPLHIKQQEDKQTIKTTRCQPQSALIAMLCILALTLPSAESAYTITNPPAGVYIEHVGQGQIDRGTFEVKTNINKEILDADRRAAVNITQQMMSICKDTGKLTKETPCDSLLHHLHILEEKLDKTYNNLCSVHTRNTRGALGKILTAVFGVNEEAYQDINKLDQNQQKLIQASNHQTKFMLTTLAAVNDTEVRIAKHLDQFKRKIEECMKAVDDMSYWYRMMDANRLSIHVLEVYQIASNFLEEVIDKQQRILRIMLSQGHIYDIITFTQLETIIAGVSRKLPSSIEILPAPVLAAKVHIGEKSIEVRGHFPIVEKSEFTLLKITAVPHQTKDRRLDRTGCTTKYHSY